jgi:hypothetical protein
MGWFSKGNSGKNIEKKPELPELPNHPNTDFTVPSPPTESSPPTLLIPNEGRIASPPQALPQKVTQDLSDVTYIPTPEIKPGMQKSKFASPDYKNAQVPEHHQPYLPPKYNEQPSSPAPIQIPTTPQINQMSPIKSYPKKDESIFIKLDKFQVTLEAFRDINQKIREIENLLISTKEIKSREEKELEDWEREIEEIKIKLDTIGKEISAPII